MSLSDQEIQEAALEWQCDPAFDHFLFSEDELVKYVRNILDLNSRKATGLKHRLCHTWVNNRCKYCGLVYRQSE